jgi:SET domain-containing protein
MVKYKVKKSKIHGKGVFSKKLIGAGETIGLTVDMNKKSADKRYGSLGHYTNHSMKPNAVVVPYGAKMYVVATKPIKCNTEITADYRKLPKAFSRMNVTKFK